ncbi:MAG: glycosyltransferase family 39 protein [Candidatus Aminicenantes bacterium]|nr:glycosyltransferase family 39 protein [Candidatus Aminicenantes bacterium]
MKAPKGPALLLASAAVLLLAWSFAVPIFEAPDENNHWLYISLIHKNKTLPAYSLEVQEANQPPLYYVLMAPFARETEVPKTTIWVDKQGVVRTPPGPKRFRNDPSDFRRFWPMRIVRILTALFSVLTVFFTYQAGRLASGNRLTGWLAGGLVAFLPQFTFRGMNISNDAFATAASAAATYFIILIIKSGFSPRTGLAAAATIALAFLSKINTLFLVIPFSLAVLTDAKPWKARFRGLAVLLLTLALIAPWMIYNQVRYGDPLAEGALNSAMTHLIDIKPLTSPYFLTRFPVLLGQSFVGLFGWMSLWSPPWFYQVFAALGILALLGLIWRFVRRNIDRRLAAILITIPILSFILVVYLNLTFTQPQGRYLFPALPAIMILAALGLEGLPFWKKGATPILVGMLFLLNVFILGTLIIPVYW